MATVIMAAVFSAGCQSDRTEHTEAQPSVTETEVADTEVVETETVEMIETELQSIETAEPETVEAETEGIDINDLEPGTIVTSSAIDSEQLEQYFQAYPIPEAVLARISGKSYVENEDVGIDQLRYLKVLHYNFDNQIQVGELIVNEKLSADFTEIFRRLFEAEYQINSIYLIDNYWVGNGADSDSASIDQNNTSAFCYRRVTGGDSLSNHALGCAIDINPQQNPYVYYDQNSMPVWDHQNADAYIERRSADHMMTTDDICYKIFLEYGFTWGGDWTNPKDYQHFEKGIN